MDYVTLHSPVELMTPFDNTCFCCFSVLMGSDVYFLSFLLYICCHFA